LNQSAVFFASFASFAVKALAQRTQRGLSLHAIAVHASFQYREFFLGGKLLLQAAGYFSTFP
jgi:hypothetical protein